MSLNMLCGHPESALVSDSEGTSYCRQCEAEARSKDTLQQIIDKMPEPQRVAFLAVVEELKPAIVEIESRPKTTQDHYGNYLRWATSQLMVVALLAAGANRNGVLSAARINGVV